ncbi:NADH-quinone oxidoreductase subunit C [Heliophilum fasciatum]|uniref:NADH-quinone oxidoreductase subunit C n=1 Tax=Heliophilum fasciatum TaxID=35700 RepID=A0A4R2RMS3_9FIRM|nr:NADH-quinone oxidoreductase subunit C [Heliophilum fasciatum]MCW2277967.1 NADH-quinone oxidoreductase subunit C [Heliophilum fasciatum]TCP64463.1 NADH-quinone oxidoreductase subunit C [Heliophilum fasciatum]
MVKFLLDEFEPAQLSNLLGQEVAIAGEGVSRALIVTPEQLIATMEALVTKLGFDYLGDLTSVDRGAEGLEVVYHLYSLTNQREIRVKAKVDAETATVPTVTTIWPGADWFEREVYDLMGISFAGHPNMTRLLLPEDFEGHPLRKSYKLQKRV